MADGMYSHGEDVLAVDIQSAESVLEQHTPAFLVHICSPEAVVLGQHTLSSLDIPEQHNPSSPLDIRSAEAFLGQHTHASPVDMQFARGLEFPVAGIAHTQRLRPLWL